MPAIVPLLQADDAVRIAHVRAPTYFIEYSGDNPAMQNARIALKVIGGGIGRFDHAVIHLINMQFQTKRIFKSAYEAHF